MSFWSDRFFGPGASLAMTVNDQLPAELVNDRREFFTHMDFPSFKARVPELYSELRVHLALLDRQLADGRPYLFGDRPGFADAAAWAPIWMGHGFLATFGELVAPFKNLERWQRRMRAIGHGQRTELEAERALEIARSSRPVPPAGVDFADPLHLRAGQTVVVTPDDYGKVPVTGELVTLDTSEVALRRSDPRAGEVVVHFPRLGYTVAAA